MSEVSPEAERGLTATCAAFVSDSARASLASEVAHATGRAFANWLACALGGVRDATTQPVLAVARALGGAPQASVVGLDDRLDVVNAALVNAVAANALDYDDMHAPTLIHPTGAVVAAALALAEREHATGTRLLRAIATGIELECRLGRALFPAHYDQGWHITATLGTLGAGAAAGVMLGLDRNRCAHLLGIAATQAAGLRVMLPNPCKSFNIGRAAAAGVLSGLLAAAALESAPDVLEARFGLFDVFGHPADLASITRALGESYLIGEVSLKPYPCGVVIHPLIDVCLAAHGHPRFTSARLRSLHARVHPRAMELAGRQHPASDIEGRFSLYHAAAVALTRGGAGLADFEACAVGDPQAAALRARMTIEADSSLTPAQAHIALVMENCERIEQTVEYPSGSPQRPLSDLQLREKFVDLARRRMSEQQAQALFGICLGLDAVADAGELRRYWTVSD